MRFKTFFLSLLFLGSPLLVLSQEGNQGDSSTQLSTDKEENLNLLDATNKQTLSAMQSNAGPSNDVLITQIGEGNFIYTNIISSNSEVKLSQNGNNNDILMEIDANVVREEISQTGNGNYALDYVPNTDLPVSLELVQNGNNLRFERHGVNSHTNDLKIQQTQGSPDIIIRSF